MVTHVTICTILCHCDVIDNNFGCFLFLSLCIITSPYTTEKIFFKFFVHYSILNWKLKRSCVLTVARISSHFLLKTLYWQFGMLAVPLQYWLLSFQIGYVSSQFHWTLIAESVCIIVKTYYSLFLLWSCGQRNSAVKLRILAQII